MTMSMRTTNFARGLSVGSLLLLVAACEGPPGPRGIPGDLGGPGTDGVDGEPGEDGELGGTGPNGQDGDDGVDGQPGQDGEDGRDGAPGRGRNATAPGLSFTITDAAIDANGIATVSFTVTDGAGVPLDVGGVYTEGAITVRFVLGWLAQDDGGEAGQYTAYTTSEVRSPITGDTATQSTSDSGGTTAEVGVGLGTYTYTFATNIGVADDTLTHTVGAWATRTFEDDRYVANDELDFVPNGDPVTVVRDVITSETCDGCHGRLEAHGGERRDVALCILCHTPQTSDPDTGNTVDMKVMVHRIHRGEDLPSVLAGTPYQIIGLEQSVNDFSTVAFPQDIARCEACHSGSQADVWNTRPSRAACGACHDLTSFVDPPPAGMTLHEGGAAGDDDSCTACHRPSGGIAPIIELHLQPSFDPDRTQVVLTILDVVSTGPGAIPEMTFDVDVDGAPRDILATPLASLLVTVAGPTTDYARSWQHTLQGSGASGTLVAEGNHFRYTFPAAMPADAEGSYSVGLEGSVLDADSNRFSAPNPVATIAVTDAEPVPRRQVVDVQRCNSCHYSLAAHDGQRNDPNYCAMCHNPTSTNDEGVARVEGTTVIAHSVHLKAMIHSIHRGEDLAQELVLGGFPTPTAGDPDGTPVDFGEVRVPGDLRRCETCHLEGTWMLPLPAGALPSREEELTCTELLLPEDGDQYCATRSSVESFRGPTAAACVACHDGPSTKAHAEINTAPSGVESCDTCHDAGSEFDIALGHAIEP
jgi:OmcA/MtrC family decaheme c-type cytochrome